ncbi:MerR family transcriptional regulator [Paenibacillus sp. S150]|uniref:MerR family transcriptional regulator n=1 Tax=Paenibacillus sp. S150 TaxID=2749826 RepID=UPI001C58E016|nr:MerR family transcriptional regulator [Paenibacillus sp. S150]MBW4083699.1 MerR family transcriptional regulator [Paenibacillus sp. S150]
MDILKTKDAADLLSVSQTTIKRWAAMFPDFFPKDRFGHYTFSEREINRLIHIKDRVNHGEALESIQLSPSHGMQSSQPMEENLLHDKPLENMLSRLDDIERSLDRKADEVVSVQLLQQREELEDLRQMIKQLAVSLETIQHPDGKSLSSHEELHPVAAARLQTPPRKRGLLRTFFSFL